MSRPQDMNGSSGDNEIGTPDDLFAWLHRRMQFNYDAFASHANALCDRYSTIEGTFRQIKDRPKLVSVLDGLNVSWDGRVVFWNPPYGRGIFHDAIVKAIDERNFVRRSVGLVKYDASTANGRLLRDHFHLEYLPRIRYKGMTSAATFSSVLAFNKPDEWRRS